MIFLYLKFVSSFKPTVIQSQVTGSSGTITELNSRPILELSQINTTYFASLSYLFSCI